MKFLFLTTYDFGGAAEATFRMHRALLKAGYSSMVMVKEKTRENNFVVDLDDIKKPSLVKRLYRKVSNRLRRKTPPGITKKDYCFYNLDERKNDVSFSGTVRNFPFRPDVIIACWISSFLNHNSLASLSASTGARVYTWGMDMSSLTGGCHYAWDCKGYTRSCADCPAITVPAYKDYPQRNLQIKVEAIERSRINYIAGSQSLYEQASHSTLFKKQGVIPKVLMCIDEEVFRPKNKSEAKKLLGIDEGKKVIFYGSTYSYEKRKGLEYFFSAMRELAVLLSQPGSDPGNLVILIAGKGVENLNELSNLPFVVKAIGFIEGDEALASVYNATDVFVNSSLEDSGPMMINESIMCGTPVVSFNIGVTADLVINGISGYTVPLYDSVSMAKSIANILNLSPLEYADLSRQARQLALNKTSSKVVVEAMIKAVSGNEFE